MNVKFHLFQELTDLFTAVIVSDKTNHRIQEMTDIPEMIEVQNRLIVKNLIKKILDLKDQKMINS